MNQSKAEDLLKREKSLRREKKQIIALGMDPSLALVCSKERAVFRMKFMQKRGELRRIRTRYASSGLL
jgi:hypothetical protein